jgi:hypothetical protein
MSHPSDPKLLHFVSANMVITPIIEACRFRVRVRGHPLRDLDTAAIS